MILFCPSEYEHAAKLISTVSRAIGKKRLMVFHEFDDLLVFLKMPAIRDRLIVVVAQTEEMLECFSRHEIYLQNLKKIIILPNDKPASVHLAYSLYPSYITLPKNDVSDIRQIIEKLKALLPYL